MYVHRVHLLTYLLTYLLPAFDGPVHVPPAADTAHSFVRQRGSALPATPVVLVEWASSRSESRLPSRPRCRDGPTSISRLTRTTSPSATTPWCAEARCLLHTPGWHRVCHV